MDRCVRISIAASILILAVALVIGWQDHQRLTLSRERNARAVSRAAGLGVSTVSLDGKATRLVTKRDRETSNEAGKQEVAELFDLLKDADAAEEQSETDKKFEKAMERLILLGPEAAELLIRQVLADKELKRENKEGILGFMLSKLCEEKPQAVLHLLPDLSGISADEKEDLHIRDTLLGMSLTNWGTKDPRATGKWMRENAARFPNAINDSTKVGVLAGAARNDPALALAQIDEMEIADKEQAITVITRSAKTAEARTATLSALRDYFSRLPDGDAKTGGMTKAIRVLVGSAFQEGYDSGTRWLETSNLDSSEMAIAGSAIEYHHTHKDTARWLDWLGKNLPAGNAGEPIGRIMTKWTELDYQEAGKWLATAPAGAARSVSVQAYAAAVSRYEPDTAVQWAMTLPAGKDRDATLRQIHQNWPKEQEAARNAFAKEHGIE
ncbi:MAG: hypothetical protein EOP88_04930 [Verrucomicrobiaceae bacterium]|nr:MAG: hypothetical protein EOP88_04930 [Verrucomicrobiaceae bacterium]